MSVRTSLRYREPRSVVWNPEQIPRSLKYSEWDYERASQITTVGSNISAFVDPITGASWTQGTSGSRPAYSATGFNGRPCASFDGSDDFLRNTTALATLGWPTSGAFEIWILANLVEVQNGTYFAYPVTTNAGIAMQIGLSAGQLRVRAGVGQGASVANVDRFPDYGRRLIRFVSDGATGRLDIDGITGTPVAAVPSFSGGPRNTIGASAGTTPNNYLLGSINFQALYKPLPSSYADKLTAHLLWRKG